MKEGQTLFGLSSGMLEQLEGVFRKERYDLVLVHGDTTTAFKGHWRPITPKASRRIVDAVRKYFGS